MNKYVLYIDEDGFDRIWLLNHSEPKFQVMNANVNYRSMFKHWGIYDKYLISALKKCPVIMEFYE